MPPRPIARIDIPAHNREELSKFYRDLFGWRTDPQAAGHPAWTFETGTVGGSFPAIDGRVKANELTIYVSSEDVEADLRLAESLAATRISGKATLAGLGEFAVFRDPSGNRIALWKSLQEPRP
jgi:predicted enzyme related to lactoylglutathione lyase